MRRPYEVTGLPEVAGSRPSTWSSGTQASHEGKYDRLHSKSGWLGAKRVERVLSAR